MSSRHTVRRIEAFLAASVLTFATASSAEARGRTLEFQRNEHGDVSGFLMHADPIRDIGFIKVPKN